MSDIRVARTGAGPALEVRGVSKSFGGVPVLRNVDLRIRPSSVHALAGHNGSGKSTLIKTLAGFHLPDTSTTGTAFGQEFPLGDHAAADKAGLRFVHQDLGLVDELSTVDNLALGAGYPLRVGRTIRWREAVRRSRSAMESLGYRVNVNLPVGLLSAAERTGVAIARALQSWSGEPSVVVLDEPTAAMPTPEVGRLFEAVDRLRGHGVGILYVTHHLDEILELADDVTVLRNGEVVMSQSADGLTHGDLVTAIVGSELAATMHTNPQEGAAVSERHVLVTEDLRADTVRGASFTVAAGEIVGLAGIADSGREDVLPAIAGAIGRSGSVRIGDTTVPPLRPRAAIRAGLGFVPANRRRAAVLPSFDASMNLTVSGLQRYVQFGLLNHRAEIEDASQWFRQLEVSALSPRVPILTLSGGNQQKVIVGRWLRRQSVLLALDEPTQGVDIGARQLIYRALLQSAREGNGVVISSSDSDELAAICHRVLVFARGKIVEQLVGEQIDAEHIDAVSLFGGAEVAP